MTARRDWAWRWTPGIGPLVLSLQFEAPPMPPRKWLKRRRDVPYVPQREPNDWVGPAGHERSEMLRFQDDGMSFFRSYDTPPPAVIAFDAAVLDALIDGALGRLCWDLADEDYGEPLGSGDDAASLAWFLSAPPDEVHAHCRTLFTPLPIDATAARDADELVAMVNVALDSWFETHSAQLHPRVVEVKSPRTIAATDWWARLHRPRIRVRVTYV